MIGRVDVGLGTPKYPGTYAVEVFCGWKLLDWSEANGWHLPGVCKWNADIPAQWVGPLPARQHQSVKAEKGQKPVEQVFDL